MVSPEAARGDHGSEQVSVTPAEGGTGLDSLLICRKGERRSPTKLSAAVASTTAVLTAQLPSS